MGFLSEHSVKLFMLMNYLSSISIVFLNKWAYTHGFPSITLTLLHFLVTFLGLKVCAALDVFTPKRVNIMAVLPLALAFCGFVVFTNLSLTYNTVGFYQLAKTMTTPVIVAIQMIAYKMTFSRPIILSLLVVCCGVALVTKADVTVNLIGLTFAAAGVLVTSMYQVWVKTKQKDLETNAFQLLYYQAPLSAGILALIVPIFEDPFDPTTGLFGRSWPTEAIVAAAASSVMAFSVNLSIFLVIGKTSPVTYNVLGHFKLCTVIFGGFMVFKDPINFNQGLGIAVALVGIFAYTHFKLKEAEQAAPTPLPTKA